VRNSDETTTVTGIVFIQTKPNCRDTVLREYKSVVPQVLKERGCIEYSPTTDGDYGGPQSLLGADTFAIIERWKTKADFEAHVASEHMRACRSRINEFVTSRTLYFLSPA
jgi:quinol monooxygenase YgiN